MSHGPEPIRVCRKESRILSLFCEGRPWPDPSTPAGDPPARAPAPERGAGFLPLVRESRARHCQTRRLQAGGSERFEKRWCGPRARAEQTRLHSDAHSGGCPQIRPLSVMLRDTVPRTSVGGSHFPRMDDVVRHTHTHLAASAVPPSTGTPECRRKGPRGWAQTAGSGEQSGMSIYAQDGAGTQSAPVEGTYFRKKTWHSCNRNWRARGPKVGA